MHKKDRDEKNNALGENPEALFCSARKAQAKLTCLYANLAPLAVKLLETYLFNSFSKGFKIILSHRQRNCLK